MTTEEKKIIKKACKRLEKVKMNNDVESIASMNFALGLLDSLLEQ
jgi:hypothetical protein